VSPDSPADRYHRRRRAPILVAIAVLMIATGVAWFEVLKPVPAASTSCNQPGPAPTPSPSRSSTTGSSRASGAQTTSKTTPKTTPTPTSKSIVTSLGSFATPSTLTGVRPADPATVTVQVFNASKISGQAKTVTNDLRAAGFASILAAANDPLYPAFDLVCSAEIRYGQAGTAAARTLLMVAPCAQLVLDNRISDSVDLALGNRYTYAPIPAPTTAALKAIHDAAIPPAVIEGQTAAPRPPAVIPPLPSGPCT
jgi:hypothetical protein